jgi:hypothetical protein
MIARDVKPALRQELEAKLAAIPTPEARARVYPAPLIFVHIPKAAGSTLQEILVKRFRGVRGYRFTGNPDRVHAFRSLSREDRDSFDLLQGHVHFGLHECLSRPATYITMLRDPVDRIVSHYHFVMANPGHYLYAQTSGRGLTLHEYAVLRPSNELDNDQVRWLCAREHGDVPVGHVSREMLEEAKWNLANAFSVVGIMERFNESVECLKARFGWADVRVPERRNTNRHRPSIAQIPVETLDAIRRLNRYDLELYNFASALFEEQLMRLHIAPRSGAPT